MNKTSQGVALFNPVIKGVIKKDFYCYLYLLDKEPIYVGIGSKISKSSVPRHLQHLTKQKRASFFYRKLDKSRKEGKVITIKIVYQSNLRKNVENHEIKVIEDYGKRSEGGTLCNITDGGDGGATTIGWKLFNNGKLQRMLPPERKPPKGWVPGGIPNKGRLKTIVAYNPETLHRRRLEVGEKLPEGFIKGSPKGVSSGPKGKTIWHNPKTGKRYWLSAEDSTKGLTAGRGEPSSTAGRTACHNPITQSLKFILKGDKPPKGYILGGLRTKSKKKGTQIWHLENKLVFVADGEKPPKGYVKGRPKTGQMLGRKRVYNSKTKESRYLKAGETLPKGYVFGAPDTEKDINSRPCKVGKVKYRSVTVACIALGISRYYLYKLPTFSFV